MRAFPASVRGPVLVPPCILQRPLGMAAPLHGAPRERGGKKGLCPVPDETLPLMSGTFNVPIYGMGRWGDLFSARQKVALVTLAQDVRERPETKDGALAAAMAIVDRCADYSSANYRWVPRGV